MDETGSRSERRAEKRAERKQIRKNRPIWKKAVFLILKLVAVLLLIVGGYVASVFIRYHRIEDNKVLEVSKSQVVTNGPAQTNVIYTAVSHNIGFGAYIPEYTFFMDGGSESRAFSKQHVLDTIHAEAEWIDSYQADLILLQEVDFNSTRSYKVDEYEIEKQYFTEYDTTFAVNYDSVYLMYPVTKPHGSNHSGMAVFARFDITSSLRRSFPISTGFSKIFDLDRCYSVNRIPTENGRELVVYSVHLSAYSKEASVREGQVKMLAEDMKGEVEAGNYVICGGDFNHDLKAEEGSTEKAATWAYPFPRSALPEGLHFAMDTLEDKERDALRNSTRNADIPYDPEKSVTALVDGFIVSDNIEVCEYYVENTGFLYSDHEPVVMRFMLLED